MECFYCKGEMKLDTAPFHTDRKGYHLTFDKVPAWVCQQCGEAYFEEKEVDNVQDALAALDKRAEKLTAAA